MYCLLLEVPKSLTAVQNELSKCFLLVSICATAERENTEQCMRHRSNSMSTRAGFLCLIFIEYKELL